VYAKTFSRCTQAILAVRKKILLKAVGVRKSSIKVPGVRRISKVTWSNRFDNLAGIGPLGVSKSNRGKDLGYDIVLKLVYSFILKA